MHLQVDSLKCVHIVHTFPLTLTPTTENVVPKSIPTATKQRIRESRLSVTNSAMEILLQ